MSMMHFWDSALAKVLPEFYQLEASPQTMYRIKKALLLTMREEHGVQVSDEDARHIRVEWMEQEQSVNLVIPPKLLTQTLH